MSSKLWIVAQPDFTDGCTNKQYRVDFPSDYQKGKNMAGEGKILEFAAKRREPPADFHLYRPAEAVERVELPVFATAIRCGFPSPADDHLESRLDLNDLVLHREATFFARVEGDSMIGLGIEHGDLLMIDRALNAEVGDVVVAELAGEFTVKRLEVRDGRGFLVAANPVFAPIPICPEQGCQIWGVVLHVIKSVRPRRHRR